MFKGTILQNLNKPQYLDPDLLLDYKILEISNTGIPASRQIKVSYSPLEPGIDAESFFNVGATFLYHNTIIFSPIEPEEKKATQSSTHPSYEFYDRFNYNSTPFNEFTSELSELESPNFYLSKTVSDNNQYRNLFAFKQDINSRDIFKKKNFLVNQFNVYSIWKLNFIFMAISFRSL